MKKLRKIAFVIMTALLINFCGNATIMASPMNVSEQGTELKVTSKTWYKFNIVVHAGDINAVDDADKNWFNFYRTI